jgi:arsenate reductase
MSVTIYHNPQCGTSRNALSALEAAGLKPRIVLYLEQGWTKAELKRLLKQAGSKPRDWLRIRGTPAEELGLVSDDVGDETILAAMVLHPNLVERPIVETPKGTALCRPIERLQALI